MPSLLPTPQPTVSFAPTSGTKYPTAVPSPVPSQIPSLEPSPVPSMMPSILPTLVPTSQPTPAPSLLPTLQPTPVPTGTPTPAPTTVDTVTLQVSMVLIVNDTESLTKSVFMSALAGKLGGADSTNPQTIKNFVVSSLAGRRLLDRELNHERFPVMRFLGATTVAFDVFGSMSVLGYNTAGAFQAILKFDLNTALDDGSLTTSLQISCSCTGISASAVSVSAKRNYPTLRPTSIPTPNPTSTPSVIPTPSPTAECAPGQYVDQETKLCVFCSAGKFANVLRPPWPTSCTLCDGGTYTSQVASTQCSECPVGKLSTEERSRCVTCSAGQYTLNKTSCADCDSGYYAPQALSGSCLKCTAGSHTHQNKAATTCTPCNAGTFSGNEAVNCTQCAIGRFSGSGASACETCTAGKVAEEIGSSGCATCVAGRFSAVVEASTCELCSKGKFSSAGAQACSLCAAGFAASKIGSAQCAACAAGSYAPMVASVICTLCAPGTSQGATGQDKCTACGPGTYSQYHGEASCTSCSGISFSFVEASSCTRCLKEYFSSSESCLQCPEGTTCEEDGESTLSSLEIQPGWWRISEETDEVRRCKHGSLACRGGLNFREGYCNDGHEGVLCAVCSDNYFFDPEESQCLRCDDLKSPGELWLTSPPLIFFTVMFLTFLVFVIRITFAADLDEMNKRRKQSMWFEQLAERLLGLGNVFRDLASHCKGGKVKLKALTSFFQIAQSIGVCDRINSLLDYTELLLLCARI